jgi:hypothetical protein
VGTPIVATREKQETRIKGKVARFKEERWGKKLKPAKRLQLQGFFISSVVHKKPKLLRNTCFANSWFN